MSGWLNKTICTASGLVLVNSLACKRQEVIQGRRGSRANAGVGWTGDRIDIKLFGQNNLKVIPETWLGIIFQSILNSAVKYFYWIHLAVGNHEKCWNEGAKRWTEWGRD